MEGLQITNAGGANTVRTGGDTNAQWDALKQQQAVLKERQKALTSQPDYLSDPEQQAFAAELGYQIMGIDDQLAKVNPSRYLGEAFSGFAQDPSFGSTWASDQTGQPGTIAFETAGKASPTPPPPENEPNKGTPLHPHIGQTPVGPTIPPSENISPNTTPTISDGSTGDGSSNSSNNGYEKKIGITENSKTIYIPGGYNIDRNAFNFNKYDAWNKQYGDQSALHNQRADNAYTNSNSIRDTQSGLLNNMASDVNTLRNTSSNADNTLQQTQKDVNAYGLGTKQTGGQVQQSNVLNKLTNYDSNNSQYNPYASEQSNLRGTLSKEATGQGTNPGTTGQASIDTVINNAARGNGPTPTQGTQTSLADMVMQGARGNGPSAAQTQFQRNLDANIAAVKSSLAGQRGISRGAAARLGAQQIGKLNQQASLDSSMLRAQEQQAAQQLAGSVTGTARSQDIQSLGLAQQGYGQTRGQDLQAAALLQDALQQNSGQNLQALLGAGNVASNARGQDLQGLGLTAQLDLGAQKQFAQNSLDSQVAAGNLSNQLRNTDIGMYGGEVNSANIAQGQQLSLDQQQLALKQQEEEFKYNNYRDWNNWLVSQYGGAGNYQAPFSQAAQIWGNIGAGAAQGASGALVDWLTRG